MSQRISNSEILEIVKEWESLRPTVAHEFSSGVVGVNRSADQLDLFKRWSTVLSVAAQERGIDAAGIDALAIEPTTTDTRALANAELAIGKLKIMSLPASAIPPGTYSTYRSILEHPAIRQARAKLVARIKSAHLQLEMADGATLEMRKPAERLIDRLGRSFLNDAATMLDYGWVGFEVIFQIKNLSLEAEQLKWLLPDITVILLDNNGIFAGLRNGATESEQVDVGCSNALCITLRAPGDGRAVSYGRSQLENVRQLWGRWKSGVETDNIDQRLHDGYFGSTDPNAGLEQTAREVLDACEIAINELLDRILVWHVGDIGRGKARLRAILNPAARQTDSSRVETNATAPQTEMPVRTTFYLEEIAADQLKEVADAALALVQGIRRHLTKPGECSGPGKVELTDGALRLERAVNPDKLKFDDPQRIAIVPRNWPTTVWSDLRDIRHHFDNVMAVCGWKDLCDGPNPLRRWEPIPLNGFVCWPQYEVDNADLQKIESAAQRLKSVTTSSAPPAPITDGEQTRLASTKAESPQSKKPTHNADFTMVNWFGEEYTFALGLQSSALKALWEEWEKTGLGLHQDTIRNSIDAERDSFRMDTAFRKHPAFGTMIQKIGDGKYKLAPLRGRTTQAPSKKKESAGITSGARQKRV
jgi:hypothetical protein